MEIDQVELSNYRRHVMEARKDSQGAYDRAVLSLAGGGLGLSLAFADRIGGDDPVHSGALHIGWLLLGLSSLTVLASFLLSVKALGKALEDLDAEAESSRDPGGTWGWATWLCNVSSGILLFVGATLIAVYVASNLGVNS